MITVTDEMVEAACDAYNKNYHPMDWRKTMRAALEASLSSPVGQIAEGMVQATFTISLFDDRSQVHTTASYGEPKKLVERAIAALQSEMDALGACPFHSEDRS